MTAATYESRGSTPGDRARERFCIVTMCSAFGGLEKHTLRLAATLRDRGHAVTILQWGVDICSRVPASELAGINVEAVPAIDMAGASTLQLWQELRKWRGWIGIFPKGWHSEGSLRFDVVARLAFRRFITIEHSCADPRPVLDRGRPMLGVIPRPALWWYRRVWKDRLRGVAPHRIVCVSDAVRRGLMQTCQYPSAKLITIVNGVDTTAFSRDQRERAELRAALGVGVETVVFGAVGRLNRDKNVALAIRAFAAALEAGAPRDARLLIVGEGDAEESLRALAVRHRVEGHVVFRGFTEQVQAVCSAIDVFLLPSLKEGLPLALLEAMSCECASIAHAVGGVPEVITNHGFGWLIPRGDEQAFERAMVQVLRDTPAQVAEMGRRARAHVVAGFDAGTQFSALANLLENRGRAGQDLVDGRRGVTTPLEVVARLERKRAT